ncbi:MAG: hypothetical protein QG553_497 [Patescibacteria group bacterium]|nr:hypothetical protein [Patescibacteria group bacterium]
MKRNLDNVIVMPGVGQEHHDRRTKEERRHRRTIVGAVVGGAAVVAATAGLGVWSYNLTQNEQPSFILEGTIEDDGQPLEVSGGVFLGCGGFGSDEAVITARIRTVVDVPNDKLDPKGRVIEVQTQTGDRLCEDALKTIKVRPELLVPGLVDEVTGWEENFMGDGTYSAAESFTAQITDAKVAGIPVHPIAQ